MPGETSMRNALRGLGGGLLLVLAGCLPVPHRVELTPRISGTVSRLGVPLAGAHLRITAAGSNLAGEALSDGDGRFELAPLSELALSASLLHDESYGFVLEINDGAADYPGLSLTEQGFAPQNLLVDCDLGRPQGLGGDMHYCRRR